MWAGRIGAKPRVLDTPVSLRKVFGLLVIFHDRFDFLIRMSCIAVFACQISRTKCYWKTSAGASCRPQPSTLLSSTLHG